MVRDVVERKRNLNAVLDNYFKFVKPAFEQFCLPVCLCSCFLAVIIVNRLHVLCFLLFLQTKKYADVILPRAPENEVAADLIIEHLLQSISSSPVSLVGNFRNLRLRNQSEPAVSTAPIRPH